MQDVDVKLGGYDIPKNVRNNIRCYRFKTLMLKYTVCSVCMSVVLHACYAQKKPFR